MRMWFWNWLLVALLCSSGCVPAMDCKENHSDRDLSLTIEVESDGNRVRFKGVMQNISLHAFYVVKDPLTYGWWNGYTAAAEYIKPCGFVPDEYQGSVKDLVLLEPSQKHVFYLPGDSVCQKRAELGEFVYLGCYAPDELKSTLKAPIWRGHIQSHLVVIPGRGAA